MLIYRLLFLAVFSFPIFAAAQGNAMEDIESLKNALFDLPNVQFDIKEESSNAIRVNLKVKQWIDHEQPELGTFYQNVILLHRGFDKQTIMNTNGYNMQMGPTELIDVFDANYISIEHRYFGSSTPENADWKYLNLKNVTADLHQINLLFKTLYKSDWISTGISKGGQTTIYYRYFYPDDVDLSIPYVAPLNRNLADDRIYSFLDEVGDKACRDKLYDFQIQLLSQREEIIPLLHWHSKGAGLTFDYIGGVEPAFEYAVLEYPFSFWQYGSKCADIPTDSDDLETYLDHFINVVGLAFYSDEMVGHYAPHYYQAGTEMGYYSFETDDFEGLIKVLSAEPSAIFFPKNTPQDFNPNINKEVINWIKNDAEGMIFIYGSIDTWTATGVDIGVNPDLKIMMMEGKHHGNARVKNMDESMKADFLQTAKSYFENN